MKWAAGKGSEFCPRSRANGAQLTDCGSSDIVDTKCINDKVEQIFTGAIAEAVDQQEPDRNGWGGC